MQDRPTPDILIEAAARHFRSGAQNDAFRTRVALNALEVSARQLRLAPARDAAERERLAVLLGKEGSLLELNRELADRIKRADEAELDGYVEHLWLTTIEKLEVDQPNYSTLRSVRQPADQESKEI